jgi:hypothetical protein
MSKLANILYPLPDFRRTHLSRLLWWESRRLTCNRAVGKTGSRSSEGDEDIRPA